MEKGSKMRRELAKRGWGHVYENPKFWPASYTKDFAVSLHMMGSDRWEEFDANVVFVLGEYGKQIRIRKNIMSMSKGRWVWEDSSILWSKWRELVVKSSR